MSTMLISQQAECVGARPGTLRCYDTLGPPRPRMRRPHPTRLGGAVIEFAVAEHQCHPFRDCRIHLDGDSLRGEVRSSEAGAAALVIREGAAALAELFTPTFRSSGEE